MSVRVWVAGMLVCLGLGELRGDYYFTTWAGSPLFYEGNPADGQGSAARFAGLYSYIARDAAGNSYVSDNHAIRKITPSGWVSTVAGNWGEAGYADGYRGAARFNTPSGLCVDGNGILWVADTLNHRIRCVHPDGRVQTVAGGAPGSSDGMTNTARFYKPEGLALDSAGNLYVSESGNSTVRKITPERLVSTLAGAALQSGYADGYRENARFDHPRGLAVDGNGNVYVADAGNYTIRKITPDGDVTTLAGQDGYFGAEDGTNGAARFAYLRGLAIDPNGNLYAADGGLRKITPSGSVSSIVRNECHYDPTRFGFGGVAAGPSGSVFAFVQQAVRRVDADGRMTVLAGRLKKKEWESDGVGVHARFRQIGGIAFNPQGMLVGAADHMVFTADAGGRVSLLAGCRVAEGSGDGTGRQARLGIVVDLAVAADGTIYLADERHTIRKVTPDGTVSTLAGLAEETGFENGSGSAARFNYVKGIALDGDGNLLVADHLNRAIRKVTPAGDVSTVAVSPSFGFMDVAVDSDGQMYASSRRAIYRIFPGGGIQRVAGDEAGTGTTDGVGPDARFDSPRGLVFDAAGNLYAADSFNHTIRKITLPGGIVTTLAGRPRMSGYTAGTGDDAQFCEPGSLAFDAQGNLFVADIDVIRKGWSFDPATSALVLVQANPDEGGVVSGTGVYPAGTEVTIQARPAEFHSFQQWTDGARTTRRVITPGPGVSRYEAAFWRPEPRHQVLHYFKGGLKDGDMCEGAPLLVKGRLYGMAPDGGKKSYGVVYSVRPDGTDYRIEKHLERYQGTHARLVSTGDRLIGVGYDELLAISRIGGVYSRLHAFGYTAAPWAGLLKVGPRLYGMASQAGTPKAFLYSLRTDGSDFRTLRRLTGKPNDAGSGLAAKQNALVSDGLKLYGVTDNGGVSNRGVIFSCNLDGTAFTVLHRFEAEDGQDPRGGLVLHNSMLYGLTASGGPYPSYGSLFAIQKNGKGFRLLKFFTGDFGTEGPLLATRDTLFGVTTFSGNAGYDEGGSVFTLKPDGSQQAVVYTFRPGSGCTPGATLTFDGRSLYGTTLWGGLKDRSTLYRIDLFDPANPASVLVSGKAKPVAAGSVEGTGLFAAGVETELKAVAAPGWKFVKWEDGGRSNPRSVTAALPGATYTALFAASTP